jgi:hypothetical protein
MANSFIGYLGHSAVELNLPEGGGGALDEREAVKS